MKASEYAELSDLVENDDVAEFEKSLRLGRHNDTALGLLLLDSVENGAKRCFRLLLAHEDAIKLGGPTALGTAAREGDIEMVRALLDADVISPGPNGSSMQTRTTQSAAQCFR